MSSRYANNKILRTENGQRYYKSNIYPFIEPKDNDLYIITTMGDRLDTLAQLYYQDPTLWWVISSSNNIPKDSINIPPGTQLRIPVDVVEFLDNYEKINKR